MKTKLFMALILLGLVGGGAYFGYERFYQEDKPVPASAKPMQTDDSPKEQEMDKEKQEKNEEQITDEKNNIQLENTDLILDGDWTRNTLHYEGFLKIKNATKETFDFTLVTFAGGNIGNLEGQAAIQGTKAVFTESEFGCQLDFDISKSQIHISQNDACQYWAGAGAVFEGDYDRGGKNIQTDLIKQGILQNKQEDDIFRSAVGKDYPLFLNTMGSYSEGQDLDGLNARVIEGFVRGVATELRGIIMINDRYAYAATVDSENGTINYYTNDPSRKKDIPKSFTAWIDETIGYTGYELIYK
ncbi:hypothetical protein [Neobacillus sp. Marseille-QA0830]